MHTPRTKLSAGLAALALVSMAGCAAAEEGGSGSSGEGLKTGKGVTADTVKILSITDLSGPAASGGKPTQAGFDAYVAHLNENGGIDGRKIEVVTADTQYDPQRAVQAYQGARNDIVAILSYGTPTTDAIRPFAADDDVLLLGLKGPFAEPNTFAQGTAFEVDAANLVSHVLEEQPDAKIGAIYQADALGEGVKRGVEAAMEAAGAQVVAEATADATSQDLTAQVTAMRKAGADHIMLGMGPGTTIAATGAVSALGYDAKLLSPGTAYNRVLLDLPVGPTMEEQMLITCSYPEWDQESEGNEEFQAALPADTEPNPTVVLGWISGMILEGFLEQAIEDGDVTPAGLIEAAQHTTVDTKGLTPDITYGEDINERTPFRESRVCSVSNDGDDGITVVKDWFESEAATSVELQ
jgi:ABC-type branched-subunit amino acid transport system substrate-binding protein